MFVIWMTSSIISVVVRQSQITSLPSATANELLDIVWPASPQSVRSDTKTLPTPK